MTPPHRDVRRRYAAVIATIALLLGVLGYSPSAHAASPVKVTITILHIWEVQCDDNDFIWDSCGNDYYAKVFFPDGERVSPRARDNLHEVQPNWQLSGMVDRDAGPFGVRIQLWDKDTNSGDDLIDIADGDDNLDITIDPRDGGYSGDIRTPNRGWSTGSGEDSAAVFFSVTVGNTPDFDSDGLPDDIELGGIVNRNGEVVRGGDLRALGANPCRPTVLVEIDFMFGAGHTHRPIQAALNEAAAMFDNAFYQPRPDCPYPTDKRGGAQLIAVVDDQLNETDQIDWTSGPNGQTGHALRNANFDPALREYYHYALWGHNQPLLPPARPGDPPVVNSSSGLCCSDSGRDILVTLGEWTTNVGTVREQSGTFMHELGHALGLGHGGGDDVNCKPNYLSIMSYVYQTTGIPDASLPTPTADLNGDTLIDIRDRLRLDYSRQQLSGLDEDSLDENRGIGGLGSDIFFWDGDGARPWRFAPRNGPVDWDRDVPTAIDTTNVAADINFMGIAGEQGCPTASPPPGSVGVVELVGHGDWVGLEFKAPLAPPSHGHAVTGSQEMTKPTADFVRAAIREAVSHTNLAVEISDAPDPVAAGTSLTYTLTARNVDAVNAAAGVRLVQTLPDDVAYVSSSPGCTETDSTVTCVVSDLPPGGSQSMSVTVDVPADLVTRNGGPKGIVATARVWHDGTDPDPGNNATTATTTVVSVADLSVAKTADRTSATADDPVTYTITVGNAGPSHADRVRVTDDLPDPAEGRFEESSASHGGTCAAPVGGELACDWAGALPPGQSRTVTVRVRVTDDGVSDRLLDRARVGHGGTDPDPADDTSSVTTAIAKVATGITATPVLARIIGVRVYFPELSATLTRADNGRPVAGRPIRFTTRSGRLLCTADTGADGVARCRDVLVSVAAILSLGYVVTSTEDGRYLGSTGQGRLFVIGG